MKTIITKAENTYVARIRLGHELHVFLFTDDEKRLVEKKIWNLLVAGGIQFNDDGSESHVSWSVRSDKTQAGADVYRWNADNCRVLGDLYRVTLYTDGRVERIVCSRPTWRYHEKA